MSQIMDCQLYSVGKQVDEETAKAMSEFASIEEQLNGVEKYAMYFLEEETSELAAEQLRLAEVLHVHMQYTTKDSVYSSSRG